MTETADVTADVTEVFEVAAPTVADGLVGIMLAEVFDHAAAAEALAEAAQRLRELVAGVFGDPSGYSSKKAFLADFSEIRDLSLATKRLMNAFRNNGILEQKDVMLDQIQPGNKPSIEKYDMEIEILMTKRAKRKADLGEPLTDDEQALLDKAAAAEGAVQSAPELPID